MPCSLALQGRQEGEGEGWGEEWVLACGGKGLGEEKRSENRRLLLVLGLRDARCLDVSFLTWLGSHLENEGRKKGH